MSTTYLTPREKEVLQCLCEGLTTKETAQKLCVSNYTISDHRASLLRKLEAKTSIQLGVRAKALKLINVK